MFHDLIVENQVYYVSKGSIKIVKDRRWSTVDNEYEMGVDANTRYFIFNCSITLCSEAINLPGLDFKFVKLNNLNEFEKDAVIDVIGYVSKLGECTTLMSKANKEYVKREVTLTDDSNYSVRVTIFGKLAETFKESDCVVAIKSVKVSDFGGRTLSIGNNSVVQVNPDIEACHGISGWVQSGGLNSDIKTYSNEGGGNMKIDSRKVIRQISEEGLGTGQKPDYFVVVGTISHVRTENVAYPSCQSENCGKKVIESGGEWRCEKCDKSFGAPLYRYIYLI